MTIQELIDQLTSIIESDGVDPDTEVRLAHQPHYPMELSIGTVTAVNTKGGGDDWCPDHECDMDDCVCLPEDFEEEEAEYVVYIGEGSQIGYLPGRASRALGWR